MPVAIGGILATLMLPLCRWMERMRIPAFMAAMFCMLLVVGIIAGMFTVLGWQVASLINDFTLIQERMIATIAEVQQYIMHNFGISLEEQREMLKGQQQTISSFVSSVAGSVTAIFSNFILIMVYMALLLFYRGHIKSFLLKFAPEGQAQEMANVIQRAANVSQQYLVGMSKMIVCLWVMYGIGFSIMGVKNALFFAVLCGLFEIVPFIGNITGTTLTVLVSAVNGGSPSMLGGIVLVYGVVQLVQGWILEPLVLGPQVKINPLFTILALVIGELIWGIPGVIVAIPLTAMLKIIFDHVESLKPYGFLMGETAQLASTPGYMKRIKQWIAKLRH